MPSVSVVAMTMLCTALLGPAAVRADDEAAMTAEVYAIAKSAKNEAVLKHISDPEHYDEMAKIRAANTDPAQENLHVGNTTVEHLDATHAIAHTRFSEKHSNRSGEDAVHLELKNGKWQVTSPPQP